MNDPITFGSLFSGAGGFDLGLERAGMQCKFQVEWDKYCQQVLQYHWHDVPKWEDVQTVNGAELPPVQVVAWGSPCQDLSTAGKRAGLGGEKSSMFFEGIRIINEMREATDGKYPIVSIWENVTGAITSNNGADFETVIREMADTGASHIEWRVLDSQWFGIPQRRRRIFMLAFWDSAAINAGGRQILSVTPSSAGYSAQSSKTEEANSRASENRIGINSQPMIVDGTRVNDVRVDETGILPALISRMGTGGNTVPMVLQDATDINGSPIAATLRGFGHGWQGQHNSTHTVAQPETSDKYILRKLTEIECERLMGWGDDHTRFRADGKETPMSQRYKMCGNGVVAPVAQWIGERITPLLRPTERTN